MWIEKALLARIVTLFSFRNVLSDWVSSRQRAGGIGAFLALSASRQRVFNRNVARFATDVFSVARSVWTRIIFDNAAKGSAPFAHRALYIANHV